MRPWTAAPGRLFGSTKGAVRCRQSHRRSRKSGWRGKGLKEQRNKTQRWGGTGQEDSGTNRGAQQEAQTPAESNTIFIMCYGGPSRVGSSEGSATLESGSARHARGQFFGRLAQICSLSTGLQSAEINREVMTTDATVRKKRTTASEKAAVEALLRWKEKQEKIAERRCAALICVLHGTK